MSKASGFLTEFKTFIARGNVMDMAVGVIIGGAFSNITNSLIDDVVMPFLGIFTNSISFAELAVEGKLTELSEKYFGTDISREE